LGFDVPVPNYLPDAYKVQQIYYQKGQVSLVISNTFSDRQIITRTITGNRTFQEYEIPCTMDIEISPNFTGLKLVGERPDIVPTQGITAEAVIVTSGNTRTLWWDWISNLGDFEISIRASYQTPNAELVKVAESMQFNN
jgi:hypothetical protein